MAKWTAIQSKLMRKATKNTEKGMKKFMKRYQVHNMPSNELTTGDNLADDDSTDESDSDDSDSEGYSIMPVVLPQTSLSSKKHKRSPIKTISKLQDGSIFEHQKNINTVSDLMVEHYYIDNNVVEVSEALRKYRSRRSFIVNYFKSSMEEAEAQGPQSARFKEVAAELERFKAFKGYITLNQLNTSLETIGINSSENSTSKAYGIGTTEAIRNYLKATFELPEFAEKQQMIEGARTRGPRLGKPARVVDIHR